MQDIKTLHVHMYEGVRTCVCKREERVFDIMSGECLEYWL